MSFKVGDVVMCVNDRYPLDSSPLYVSDTTSDELKAGEFYVVLEASQGHVAIRAIRPNGRFWDERRFVRADPLVESIIKIQNESNSSHS